MAMLNRTEIESMLEQVRELGRQEEFQEREKVLNRLDAMVVDIEEQRAVEDTPELRKLADFLRQKINHVRYVKL